MSAFYKIVCILLFFVLSGKISAQDTVTNKGQVSLWGNYNKNNTLPVNTGIRYIPTINKTVNLSDSALIDVEGSANIYATFGFRFFDSVNTQSKVKPYRFWARFTSHQLEVRLGLQKINFGSAMLLRPLMWFDQIDPRDPLQLTEGVWGILTRYYFLNNANVWLWGLYGNNQNRTWEIAKTSLDFPEYGGRLQLPTQKGEIALSLHHRNMDARVSMKEPESRSHIPENRIGIDGKWDLGIGLWTENTWTHASKDFGTYTNQEIFNLGADYTLGIGNGLNLIFEQLLYVADQKAFHFENKTFFSGTSLGYPIGIKDNLSTIFYYDWDHQKLYSFLSWKRQLKNMNLYLMTYWNPKDYQLPQQGTSGNLFSGKGFQIMLTYNY